MKEYNKEKLHEYAKELFALCLEKNIIMELSGKYAIHLSLDVECTSYINENFSKKEETKHINYLPIWELIEKVKSL